MKPTAVKETEEQKNQRLRAQSDNRNAMQTGAERRTMMFNRIVKPRLSIATGRSAATMPLM